MVIGHSICDTSLDILRSIMRQRFGEGIAETRAEHNNELLRQERSEATQVMDGSLTCLLSLTAMSALSANTYSCGGDAGLFGRGGEEGSFVVSGFGVGLKYLLRPLGLGTTITSASSSLEGGEDSEELSERDIIA